VLAAACYGCQPTENHATSVEEGIEPMTFNEFLNTDAGLTFLAWLGAIAIILVIVIASLSIGRKNRR